MRTIILVLVFLVYVSLNCKNVIVDSVFSVPRLDGVIDYNYELDWWGINISGQSMDVGDWAGGGTIPNNSTSRSYLTFDIPLIPETCRLDSVILRIYQNSSPGNGIPNYMALDTFPVWDVLGGDTIKCVVSHVNYGNNLYYDDWEKGDYDNINTYTTNIGVITHRGINIPVQDMGERGYRYLNVTESVLNDYKKNRNISQFRISFECDTDYDNRTDKVAFTTSESFQNKYKPILKFYKNAISDSTNSIDNENVDFTISPNPVGDYCKIVVESNNRIEIEINLFNIQGKKIESLIKNTVIEKSADFNFCTNSLPNGVYFIGLRSRNYLRIKKLVILK